MDEGKRIYEDCPTRRKGIVLAIFHLLGHTRILRERRGKKPGGRAAVSS